MIHSMTGYAAQMHDFGAGVLHLELRTVNSRYLDMNFRIGEELRLVEPTLRELISGRIGRGKVECRLNLLATATMPRETTLNHPLLARLADWQAGVRAQLPEAAPLSVAEALRWPGMLGDERLDAETLQTECSRLARVALDELLATRAREGEKLGAMILDRVAGMRALVARAAPLLPQALVDYQERLAVRLREAAASLDEERIRQEIGLYATRIDVAEELTRLTAHLDEVARVIDKGGAIGKRLDFLMQELNREANTLASKSVSSQITSIAVDMKLLIEQMREQIQNLE